MLPGRTSVRFQMGEQVFGSRCYWDPANIMEFQKVLSGIISTRGVEKPRIFRKVRLPFLRG